MSVVFKDKHGRKLNVSSENIDFKRIHPWKLIHIL